jgi:hypothetical protein
MTAYNHLIQLNKPMINFADESPKDRRFFRLDAIIDYAKAHNFPEAAKRAKAAKNTDEDILPILAMAGYWTFDATP